MFFQGTLQDGIATALQQSKQVVCFVTDDGDESSQWENEFLPDHAVKTALENQAVVLRLLAGSEEAGFLEALFPVPRKPTVVVIQNGQLREYIAAGTSKEEFMRRLSVALGSSSTETPPTALATEPTLQSTSPSRPPQRAPIPQPIVEDGDDDDLYGDAAPLSAVAPSSQPASSPSPPTNANPEGQPSAQVSAIFAERAARLEADKRAKEAAAKKEAEKRAKERREVNPSNEDPASNITSAENSYAVMIRKKKQDEREERQRILKRIEDDKRERRERDAKERQARLLLSATQDLDATSIGSTGQAIHLPSQSGGAYCNLQVRLFDASTLRNRFPSDATLGSEVRKWIDENRTDGQDPYTFRVVLTPLPNKAILPSEEADSLLDLGLAPSSTIVLVPRVKVASAFEQTGGLVFRVWASLYRLLAMLFGLPGLLLGGGRARNAERRPEGEEVPLDDLDGAGSARRRVRGFQNPDDRRRDQQLYNGNSLNFEPRRDEDAEAET